MKNGEKYVTVDLSPEEAEVFERVMTRLRAAAPTNPTDYYFSHSEFQTENFRALCMWDDGDGDGLPTRPQWQFYVQYTLTPNHCDGRGVYWLYPLRRTYDNPERPWETGPCHPDDRIECPGCVACSLSPVGWTE